MQSTGYNMVLCTLLVALAEFRDFNGFEYCLAFDSVIVLRVRRVLPFCARIRVELILLLSEARVHLVYLF
jgi:hypothetical protein